MPNPDDLLKAWQDAIREVGGAAASLVAKPGHIAAEALAPLQQQAETLQRVLQRQLDFERELVERVLAPARVTMELVDNANAAYRAQARAFRSASVSFGQLAELMEQQAVLIERASAALKDPVAALRATASELRGGAGEVDLGDAAG
jgi:hypothetical protein